MAYIIGSDLEDYIISSACALAGVEREGVSNGAQYHLMHRIFSEIGAYINDDFISWNRATDDGSVKKDHEGNPANTVPYQIADGAVIPIMAARLSQGMQSVTSISEGGSSANFTPTYSDKIGNYAAVLCRFKRLGYPQKWGAL